ncbi:CBS domain-containing protein [Geodermatophilus sp. CPCC 206100]|uniref:CBS domain-containing protein n=1 Tax=Geodermatophilus sp. CPCC 206100 TaxID=3020054 RepID=UPI003AFFABD7
MCSPRACRRGGVPPTPPTGQPAAARAADARQVAAVAPMAAHPDGGALPAARRPRPRVLDGAEVAVVARTMVGAGVDAVPVVDRDGRLFGLVTLWHSAEMAAAAPPDEGRSRPRRRGVGVGLASAVQRRVDPVEDRPERVTVRRAAASRATRATARPGRPRAVRTAGRAARRGSR